MNFIIIGLGNYGASLAKKLSAMGHEVIGVDKDLAKVEFFKDRVSNTICMDATDVHAIRALPLVDADLVVVAIGDDFGTSVKITALLKKLKVNRIVSRETSSLHITVMEALGIHETVNPEFDSAQIFAEKIVMQGVKGIYPLSRDIKIAEIPVPSSLIGKPESIFKINHDYKIEVIAVKRNASPSSSGRSNGDTCEVLTGRKLNETFRPEATDILIVLGNSEDIRDLIKHN
jgi:trk system potassium uptake protein TrkA